MRKGPSAAIRFRRLNQQVKLQVIQRQGFGMFEQPPIEPLKVLHQHLGKAAAVHGLPQGLQGWLQCKRHRSPPCP